MHDFAKRIKQIRQKRNYTQKQLADIVNVAVHTICNYEQGLCTPNCKTLLELAQALDVTPEFLLLGEQKMNNYTNAIQTELMQITNYDSITEIKKQALNSTILAHLEMSDDLVESIKNKWNSAGIFTNYCTRNYVQEVIIRYCQNRTMFKNRFQLEDGMLKNMETQ